MNSISVIEFLIVGIIVLVQSNLALKTRGQIRLLRNIIPGSGFFEISKFNIPIDVLQTHKPTEILAGIIYEEEAGELIYSYSEEKEGDANQVSLVNPNQVTNPTFDAILLAINVYLLRNKGAATDFSLIKDVVERNIDIEEDEINQTVTIPLYLGLMGTIIGIVFGLITLFFISDSNQDFDIRAFLGGVSIAMFASFFGLFCTVANSSFNLKAARRELERAKNAFYTFLQTELLPVINTNVSASIHKLNTNLVSFNDAFATSLNKLSGMLGKNHDALVAQERILQSLENVDITSFAKANVLVLKELKTGTERLEQFNVYLNSLNQLALDTRTLSALFQELLVRTNNFEGLAGKLDLRVEESNKLAQFLNDHFQKLNDSGELMRNTVIGVDDILIKSLVQLEEHTQAKIESLKKNSETVEDFMAKSLGQIEEHTHEKVEAIKQIQEKEEQLLIQTMAEKENYLAKLGLLDDLNSSVNELKTHSFYKIDGIGDEVRLLKDTVGALNETLEKITERTSASKNITRTIKRFFGSKD